MPIPLRLLSVAWLIACGGVSLASEPYTPVDEGEVLETLPTEVFASRDELTTLRERLGADPRNAELAAAVAQQYVRLGKRGGGPRFLGYARAALDHWWEVATPPSAILPVRAKLKETDHDYAAALADLRELVRREPENAQAWLEITNLHRVRGEYDAAWEACETLEGFAGPIATALCKAPLMALTGRAEEAYERLGETLPQARVDEPGVVQWMLTMQAEIARARGDEATAEAHYKEALENDPDDTYVKRAYADYLLDRDRAAEALPLLRDHLADNGAMLRAAIAARDAGEAGLADRWSDQLDSRFEETRMRGDRPHGRFESRFVLEFRADPQRALELAADNWSRQKEHRDTRNLLEAALAAGDRAAADPAIAFLREAGTEDVDLKRLVERLEAE